MARAGEPPEPRPEGLGREDALAALVERLAAGDQAALAALYDATSAFVYSLSLRIIGDPAVAEEVTLDVYMQAYSHAPGYDPRRGTPSAWLMTLARSRAIDRLRLEAPRARRQDPLEAAIPLAAPGDGPEESSSAAERGRLTRKALAALAPEQRQVIEIAYFSGLSHAEIAARLGEPLGTVKTRIRTGLVRLRDLLGPLLAEERS
jgi:RNA polymerase sigma-70 factor, ECF subfamily